MDLHGFGFGFRWIYVDLHWFLWIYIDSDFFVFLIYMHFHWFTLIFIDLGWFALIYIDFHWFTYISTYFYWFSLIYIDLYWFSMIFVDLGRFWRVAGLGGLATCGALWQPVAPCGALWHGDPTPYIRRFDLGSFQYRRESIIRCIEPGGLWGWGGWWIVIRKKIGEMSHTLEPRGARRIYNGGRTAPLEMLAPVLKWGLK